MVVKCCGHEATLLVTQEVTGTSTSIARRHELLKCGLERGHVGAHRSLETGETWEGSEGDHPTVLRHEMDA